MANLYDFYINDGSEVFDTIEADNINEALSKFAHKCKPLKADGFDVQVGDIINYRLKGTIETPEDQERAKILTETLKIAAALQQAGYDIICKDN